jgi:hypothetical protein
MKHSRAFLRVLTVVAASFYAAAPGSQAAAGETIVRGQCEDCNTGIPVEHFCVGRKDLGMGQACGINSRDTFDVYRQEEIDTKLQAIRNDLDKRLQAQQKSIQQISDELLKRFGEIPLELVKDDAAYQLLRQRLTKDLTEVFQAKETQR